MLLNLLLDAAENSGAQQAQDTANANGGGSFLGGWGIYVIIAVMIVGMFLMMVLPNRKKQKEYQKMQNEIRVGTKIMTIGRMVGTVTKVYPDNTLELDVGTPGNPVVITITREAVGINMTVQEELKAQQEALKNKKNGTKKVAENTENQEAQVEDNQVEGTQTSENVETTETEVADTKPTDDDAI